MTWEKYREEWLRLNTCNFCQGSRMHTCTSYKCQPAYKEAGEYFDRVVARDEVASGKRVYVASLSPYIGKEFAEGLGITGAWMLSGKKEEIIIRFHDNIPNMQQAAYTRYAVGCLKKSAENAETQEGAALHGLIDGMPSRAWKESDREIIENGIPTGIKKDAAGEEYKEGKGQKDGG